MARCAANGSIVQELEGLFARRRLERDQAAVASDWTRCSRATRTACCCKRCMNGRRRIPDLCRDRRRFNREHFFNKYPELRQIIAHMSDADIGPAAPAAATTR